VFVGVIIMFNGGVSETCVNVDIIPDSIIRRNTMTIMTIANVSIILSFISLYKDSRALLSNMSCFIFSLPQYIFVKFLLRFVHGF